MASLFHLANEASPLPLVSQKLALAHPGQEAVFTSGAILVAQLVMIPVSLLVGHADQVGRKPLLLVAIAALVLRGILFTLSGDAAWLLAVQVLDGVGIGLFDALVPPFWLSSCVARGATMSLEVLLALCKELAALLAKRWEDLP